MIQNIAFRRLREEFHGGFIRDFRHISVGTLDPVHKHLSVAFNGQLIAKLRPLRKIRLDGGAGTRHDEGERIGSGIIRCHTVDLPAGENVALVSHGLNGLIAGTELCCRSIFIGDVATLYLAVLSFDNSNSGIPENEFAGFQYLPIATYDAEIVLCPVPAFSGESVPSIASSIGNTCQIVKFVAGSGCKNIRERRKGHTI